MNIVEVDLNTWKQFRNIRLDALKTDPLAFLSTYERELEMTDEEWIDRIQKQKYFMAIVNKIPAGIAGAKYVEREDAYAIVSVWVDPRFRSKGVALMLIDFCNRYVKDNGFNEITLCVKQHNSSAIRLYEKAGFVLSNECYVVPEDRQNIYYEYVKEL